MKILYILVFVLFFTNCKKTDNDTKVITVSIEPQKYFLEKIAGEKYSINTLIPAGSNPETYDPTPSQMLALGKSLIYFQLGYLSFEKSKIREIKENTPNMQIVNCSDGINPINDCEHEGHSHDGNDPHVWSSPKTASMIALNMYNGLAKFDSENKDYYHTNYTKLVAEFDSVDVIIRNCLEKAESKDFIIYHSALSYYASEYGLNQYSIEHEGKSPSPAQLKMLIDLGKEKKIKVVFIQEEYDKKNAETIANEIGAKIVTINLLSYNWSEEMIKIAKAFIPEHE